MGSIKTVITALLLALGTALLAQDEVYPWAQRDRKDATPLDYEYQREADVMWSKNIWRVIDIRQKMNKPFAYPQAPLIKLIHGAAKTGKLTVYDPSVVDADQLKRKMDTAEVVRIGTRDDTIIGVSVENPEMEEVTIAHNTLSWDKIIKYRVKEVWFFDTKTSTMKVRILAIAPVMEYYDASGNYMGDMTMYWVPYQSLRGILAKNSVYNAKNDTQPLSWEDVFEMRQFESYIYKESNVYDRSIPEYATGIDGQLESERIKQELFEKEHDLWNY